MNVDGAYIEKHFTKGYVRPNHKTPQVWTNLLRFTRRTEVLQNEQHILPASSLLQANRLPIVSTFFICLPTTHNGPLIMLAGVLVVLIHYFFYQKPHCTRASSITPLKGLILALMLRQGKDKLCVGILRRPISNAVHDARQIDRWIAQLIAQAKIALGNFSRTFGP